MLQVPEQSFPCNPGRRPWQNRSSPCSSWRTSCQSRWMCLEGNCSPWREADTGAGFWQGMQPVGTTHAGAVYSWRTESRGKDPMLEEGKSMRRKERQWQGITNWPYPPFPIPHGLLWGQEVEELEMKAWSWA